MTLCRSLKMFTSLVICFLLVGMLGSALAEVNDGYLINDTFDNQQVGNKPADWKLTEPKDSPVEVSKDSTRQFIKLADNHSSEAIIANRTFPAQTVPISFEWDFMEKGEVTYTRYMLQNGNEIAVELILICESAGGNITLKYVDDFGVAQTALELNFDQWYAGKIVADPQTKKYDLYIDGVQQIAGVPFKFAVDALDTISIKTAIFYTHEAFTDNVRVSNKNISLDTGSDSAYQSQTTMLEIPPAEISNPDIDKVHDITYENWKGVTWAGARDAWGTMDGSERKAVESDIKDMKYGGVHWVRISCKPTDTWETLDQKVNDVINSGFRPLMYYSKKINPKTYGTEEEEKQDAEYLKSVILRYKDRVRHIEVHNEPNVNNVEWDLGGGVGAGSDDPSTPYNTGVRNYVKHLKNVYETIKSIDPDITVIMGGLSSGSYWEGFMRTLTNEGGYNYFDETAFHPYGRTPADVIDLMDKFKGFMDRWPEPKNTMPIWVTEIGWHSESTWSALGGMYVPNEDIKAQYIMQIGEMLSEYLDPIRPIFFYALHEINDSAGFGLTQKSFKSGVLSERRLPAMEAFRSMNDHVPIASKTDTSAPSATTAPVATPAPTPAAVVTDSDEIKVVVNGTVLVCEVPPIIENDRTLVPLRAIFEALGAGVAWNQETQTVTGRKGSTIVKCTIDSPDGEINGEPVTLDVPPMLIEGRTLVPVRFVSESLGADVQWDGDSQTVTVTQ